MQALASLTPPFFLIEAEKSGSSTSPRSFSFVRFNSRRRVWVVFFFFLQIPFTTFPADEVLEVFIRGYVRNLNFLVYLRPAFLVHMPVRNYFKS